MSSIATVVREAPSNAVAVTASDTEKFRQSFILVQTSGNITVELADGGELTFTSFSGLLEYQIVKVKATGLTASGIYRIF